MTRVLFDTSVLVAALVKPHPAHTRAFPWLRKAKAEELLMIISSHTIAELYSVLTTLPVSPRITSDIAWRLIQEDILNIAEIVPLSAADYKTVIKKLRDNSFSGGIVYDALIYQAAVKTGADTLLTLNSADFRRLQLADGPVISEP
jgi:predicted nucleic acid-binding protein